MKTPTLFAVIAALVIAGGAWYYFVGPQTAAAPTGTAGINGSPNQGNLGQPATGQPQQPMADGAEGTVIGSNLALGTNSSTALGTYLVAYNGMTLYTYSPDGNNVSNCSGQCATNWPPYVVGAEDNVAAQLQAGVTGKVATIVRADGKIQMTYNGHPLYFYIKDTKPGDTTGQGVGGVWYVVKP